MTSKLKTDVLETVSGSGTIALTNQLTGMTSASMPSGSVLQVVSTNKTDTFVTSSTNSFVDITGLNATITPASTSSKILVNVAVSFSAAHNVYCAFYVVRGSTAILQPTETGTGIECAGGHTINNQGNNQYSVHKEVMTGLDSPNTASAITYKVQVSPMRTSNQIAYINRSQTIGDDNQFRTTSTITLTEIKG